MLKGLYGGKIIYHVQGHVDRPDTAVVLHFRSDLALVNLDHSRSQIFTGTDHYSSIFSDRLYIRIPLEIWNVPGVLGKGVSLREHTYIAIDRNTRFAWG